MSNLAGKSASFYNKSLNMNTLTEKLAKFESQLQALIEQGATRMVPKVEQQSQISSRLIETMQASAQIDQTGAHIAADTYIVMVGDDHARNMAEDSSIKEALLQILVEAAKQSGTTFQSPPRIKISVDDSIETGRFEIWPSFSLQDNVETSTLAIDPGDDLSTPKDAFLILQGNQVIPLTGQVINVGRRTDNQIVIDHPKVSRKHAQLRVINNRYVIFDLESTGGTFVNKVRIEQASLFPGDVITLAGVDLVYGQDAGLISGDGGSSTQPLSPIPRTDN